jgi:hypothetical protein
MQFSKVAILGALSHLAGTKEAAADRELRRAKSGKGTGCTPSALEGVWTHMSQGVSLATILLWFLSIYSDNNGIYLLHLQNENALQLSYYNPNQGAGLRNWIVTCPRLHLTNGNTTEEGTPGGVDIEWGNGDCQIADANAHQPPVACIDENEDGVCENQAEINDYGGK